MTIYKPAAVKGLINDNWLAKRYCKGKYEDHTRIVWVSKGK